MIFFEKRRRLFKLIRRLRIFLFAKERPALHINTLAAQKRVASQHCLRYVGRLLQIPIGFSIQAKPNQKLRAVVKRPCVLRMPVAVYGFPVA